MLLEQVDRALNQKRDILSQETHIYFYWFLF